MWAVGQMKLMIHDCMAGDLINKPSLRWDAMKKAEAIAMKDVIIMPLYQQSNAVMVKPKVKGLILSPSIGRSYKDVFFQ